MVGPYSSHQVAAVPLALTVPVTRAPEAVMPSTPSVEAAGGGGGGGGAPVA